MIKSFYRSCFLFVLIISFSCKEEKKTGAFALNTSEKNDYASYFKIYKQDGYSILVTYQTADKKDSAIYVLYSKEKPQLDLPANYVKVPSQKVACLSSVFVGFL